MENDNATPLEHAREYARILEMFMKHAVQQNGDMLPINVYILYDFKDYLTVRSDGEKYREIVERNLDTNGIQYYVPPYNYNPKIQTTQVTTHVVLPP
jgi:hypothetical protein